MYRLIPLMFILSATSACTILPPQSAENKLAKVQPDVIRELKVGCSLPGKVKKTGGSLTYVSPRREIRTSKNDCIIRGGTLIR